MGSDTFVLSFLMFYAGMSFAITTLGMIYYKAIGHAMSFRLLMLSLVLSPAFLVAAIFNPRLLGL